MGEIKGFFDRLYLLVQKIGAGNELWQFVAAATILVAGFIILEILWRYANRRIADIPRTKKAKGWVAYALTFTPALRLAGAVLILRIAEIPLILPPRLLLLIHGLETFLFAIALMIFIFQLIRFLDLVYLSFPARVRKALSEQTLNNLKGILRIIGIFAAAVFFVYTQKHLFPEWLWTSSLWRYGSLVPVFIILYFGGKLLSNFLETLTAALKDSKERARLRLVLRATLWPIRLLMFAIAVYAVQEILLLPESTDKLFETVVNIIGTLVIIVFLYRLLDVIEFELTKFVKREDNEFDMNLVQMVRIVAKVLIVVFGIIYLLKAATGKPMTTLLAGLGIGGLAIALAAQDTLKNLFGSFMLMIDKPFVVGDWVNIEGTNAHVEEIGFRCTRIRTFFGHVISIPNEKMAAISIENVQRRPYIRRYTNITITYDTPPDKVEKAVQLIKDILKDRPELDPEAPSKVHFNEFNDASLNIVVVYYFKQNDYWASIRFNEVINFEIMRAFEKEGIEFAFPTTTTYLAQDDRRPLNITLTGNSKGIIPDSID